MDLSGLFFRDLGNCRRQDYYYQGRNEPIPWNYRFWNTCFLRVHGGHGNGTNMERSRLTHNIGWFLASATGQTRDYISTLHVNIADQPVLISRRALVNLGTIIDFQEKYTIYKSIDPNKIINSLERGEIIIFSLPLTGNLLKE